MRLSSVFLLVLFLLQTLSSSASAQNAKLDVLTGGDSHLTKLDSALLFARQDERRGVALAQTAARTMPGALRDGEAVIQVGVPQGISDDLRAAFARNKVTILAEYPELHTIVARCSHVAPLEALVRRSDVGRISPNPEAMTQVGSVTSQGDVSQRSNEARSVFGIDGNGLKVGVLSDSFHRIIGGTLVDTVLTGSSPQQTGDLPASVEILDPGPSSDVIDEGAAMAELIYDVVPGAAISFASAFTSYAAFANNITVLADAGCDVIVDDVFYFIEPMFQDGPIALAAEQAVSDGISFYSSAGNNAANGHSAPFRDINPGVDDASAYPPTGEDYHDFGGGDTHLEILVPNGGFVRGILHWNQPYDSAGTFGDGPGSAADLDLHLSSSSTGVNAVMSGANVQGTIAAPEGDAVEFVGYANTSGAAQTLYFVIDRYLDGPDAVTPDAISLTILPGGGTSIVDTQHIGDRSLYGHAAAAKVQAVGAIGYTAIDAGAPYISESFTALGGDLPYYFDGNGAPIPDAPVTRAKPEISAVQGTNTTFFGSDSEPDGFPNFFGTSAAAPHVAAVATLMLEVNPTLTPAAIYSILQTTAVDADAPGYDFRSGFGWVDALAAVTAAATSRHSADQNGDNEISLSELLRVIQFFNSEGLSCAVPAESTEDGYQPGTGDESCAPHDSDYNAQDWGVVLSELLRLIQFFNSEGYFACPESEPSTEDGFCPGAP